MANCVNINSKDFRSLLRDTNLTEKVLAAKVSLWQDHNGLENFPTKQDIYKNMQLPSRLGVYSRELTTKQIKALNRRIGIYNRNNQETSIFFDYTQIGESDKYTWVLNNRRGTLPLVEAPLKKKEVKAPVVVRTQKTGVDTTLQERLFEGKESVTTQDMLQTIGESEHPLNDLAKILLPLAEDLNVPINLTEGENIPFSKENFIAIGMYDHSVREISIAKEAKFGSGKAEATILHEILHALTYGKLGTQNAEIIEDFTDLYKYAKEHSQLSEAHAYDDLHEFIVAIFTDSIFIRDLQNIPAMDMKAYPNLFAEFFDKLMKLLGIKSEDTAYTQAFNIATNILAKPVMQNPDSITEEVPYTEADFGDLFSRVQEQQSVEEFLESKFTEQENQEIEAIQEEYEEFRGFKERFEAYQAALNGVKDMDEVTFSTTYGMDSPVGFTSIEEAVNHFEEQMAEMERQILEDGEAILGNSTPLIVEPRYEAYLKQKTALLNYVENNLKNLYIQRAQFKSTKFNDKIAEFRVLRDNLQLDIYNFGVSTDKLALVKSFFEQDVRTVKALLSNPTIDNYYIAKDLLDYMLKASNTSISLAAGNTLTPFIENAADASYSKEVLDMLTSVRSSIHEAERMVATASEVILLDLLERHKEKFTAVYNVSTLEEVRKLLTEDLEDITGVESLIFSTGENVLRKNNVLDSLLRVEYEIEEGKALARQTQISAEISATEGKATQALASMGETWDLFRQKDTNGLTSGTLIEKYSVYYQNFLYTLKKDIDGALFAASASKNWTQENSILTLKFHTLNNDTEFIDIGLLHDIGEGTNLYDNFKTGTSQEAQTYKQELIDKIGQIEYDNIVETQRNHIDAYLQDVESYINYKVNKEGVSAANLSADSKRDITIFEARNNPLTFSEHFKSKGDNLVQYTIGTQSSDATAKLTYNTFIPKKQDNTGKETNYYDAQFDKIATNPALLNSYTALRKGVYATNQNTTGSSLNMHNGDLISFKKTAKEELLERGLGGAIKKGLVFNIPNLIKVLKIPTRFIGKNISGKSAEYAEDNLIGTPAQINSYKGEIESQYRNIILEIEGILNVTTTSRTTMNWSALDKKQQKRILEVLGVTEADLFIIVDIANQTGSFKLSDLKRVAQIQVLNSQKVDLPLAIKAALELSAVHKARTEAQNKVRLIMEKSAEIKDFKGNPRENELKRQKFFYNHILLNKKGKKHYGNLSQKLIKWFQNNNTSFSKARMFYKYFTDDQKKVYKVALTRWKQLQEKGLNNLTDAEMESLLSLENTMKMMGEDYYASTVFQALASKLFVTINLAMNPLAQIMNKAQGYSTAVNRDGKYWSKGNVYKASSFLHKKPAMRVMSSKWAKQADILRLFVDRLGLITDGTTELERAEGELKKKFRIFMPMGLMQWAEDSNQTLNLLSKFMDMQITDNNGVNYPLFDGKKFNGYDIKDGVLVLKPNFSNQNNQETFLDMTSDEMAGWKMEGRNIINELNGDYSSSGTTRIKGTVIGAAAMTYKTWLPRFIGTRWKTEQKNIVTGKVEKGFYLDAMQGGNSLAGGFMLGGASAIAFFATAIPLLPVALGAGIAGYGIANHISKARNKKLVPDADEVVVSWQKQVAFVLTTIAATPTIPLNIIAGRELIGGSEGMLGLDENSVKQKATLETARDIARNLQYSMAIMALHFAIQMAFGPPDEEEEARGEEGSKQRKRWNAQQEQKRKDYSAYYLATNITGRLFQETNTALDLTVLGSTFGSRNTLEGSFQKMAGLLTELTKEEGKDIIQSGPNEGQSKTGRFARKTFLPPVVRYIGVNGWDDPLRGWRAGFETGTQAEWQKTEVIDQYRVTDFKKATTKWENAIADKKQEAKKEVLLQPEFRKYATEEDIPVEGITLFNKRVKLQAKKIVARENLQKEPEKQVWKPVRRNFGDAQEKKKKE